MEEQSRPNGSLQSRLVALLRRRVAIPGRVVAATYEELAAELGSNVTARDVRTALVNLRLQARFTGRPHLGHREFRGRLAW